MPWRGPPCLPHARLRLCGGVEASWGGAVGGNVVAQPHGHLVVLPPHGGSRLVEVLSVEADARQGVLPIALPCKCQEHTLHMSPGKYQPQQSRWHPSRGHAYSVPSQGRRCHVSSAALLEGVRTHDHA